MTSQQDHGRVKYSAAEDEHIIWAVRHGGSDMEIAHDLRRSYASVKERIKMLRVTHDLPDRRAINSGRKGKGTR